eukprot:1698772-Rhodomonas_salina.1
MVLRSIIRDEHDVHLKKGSLPRVRVTCGASSVQGKHAKSAKTVAAAALQRSHQATDADAAAHLSPNLVNVCVREEENAACYLAQDLWA